MRLRCHLYNRPVLKQQKGMFQEHACTHLQVVRILCDGYSASIRGLGTSGGGPPGILMGLDTLGGRRRLQAAIPSLRC